MKQRSVARALGSAVILAERNAVPLIDRRGAVRRQPRPGTLCHLTSPSGEDLGTALVWNLSTTGAGLLLRQPLEEGPDVEAELSSADGTFSLPCTLQVTRVCPLSTGDVFLGGAFSRKLTSDELQSFAR